MTQLSEQDHADIEKMSFREAMHELDAIVSRLESNELELEDGLAAYERGVALLRNLKTRLDGAQQKVEVLVGELNQSASDDEIDTTLSKA